MSMRNAADNARRPLRTPIRPHQQRKFFDAELLQRLPRTDPAGRELADAFGDGLAHLLRFLRIELRQLARLQPFRRGRMRRKQGSEHRTCGFRIEH
jgi:hypothetical protein